MDKTRVILTLLVKDGLFVNSRRFALNNMCNVETILTYLDFRSIDEVVVLDVSRGRKNSRTFTDVLQRLTKQCFVPVVAGGGISSIEDCNRLLRAGADKLAINSKATEDIGFIAQASRTFGAQCIVGSVDVKKVNQQYRVYSHNGSIDTGIDVLDWTTALEEHQVGEILLRSMDHDGMANGYDLELLELVSNHVAVPIIATGGVGDFPHLKQGVQAGAQAVALGNIFHFMGISLIKAKDYLHSQGVNVSKSKWNFSIREHAA